MLTRMRFGTMRRRLAATAVPLAFAAALPLVQWCPLGTAITLRDCLPGDVSQATAAANASGTAVAARRRLIVPKRIRVSIGAG